MGRQGEIEPNEPLVTRESAQLHRGVNRMFSPAYRRELPSFLLLFPRTLFSSSTAAVPILSSDILRRPLTFCPVIPLGDSRREPVSLCAASVPPHYTVGVVSSSVSPMEDQAVSHLTQREADGWDRRDPHGTAWIQRRSVDGPKRPAFFVFSLSFRTFFVDFLMRSILLLGISWIERGQSDIRGNFDSLAFLQFFFCCLGFSVSSLIPVFHD